MLTTRRRGLPSLLLSACAIAASLSSALPSGAAAATKRAAGPVDVYYASSLQDILEQHVGPHFDKATGYTFTGFSGASGTLANEIKGGVAQGDVFISANAATNATLEGNSNGNWVSWFVVFGASPLVIGYNPRSSFASALKTERWFNVITEPGFRLGRTDPSLDPKGKLTVQALTAAEQIYGANNLTAITATTANVYPESSLVGELQAGQLDAGFFYASEAKAAGIPTISLGKLYLAATYTITILNNAPHEAAAEAFVNYLLSTPGVTLLKREGMTVVKPRLTGPMSSVPRSLRHLLPAT